MWSKYHYYCNSFIPKTIGKTMGTHKNKKKKGNLKPELRKNME